MGTLELTMRPALLIGVDKMGGCISNCVLTVFIFFILLSTRFLFISHKEIELRIIATKLFYIVLFNFGLEIADYS